MAANEIKPENPDATVAGKTISEWTQDWWRWALQAPFDTSPQNLDSGHAVPFFNEGSIFFIAGNTDATINVPANESILFPMINAFDTEGPGIETIEDFFPKRGSYSDEARYITDLAQGSIHQAYAKLTKDGQTLLNIHGSNSRPFSEETDIFAIGEPKQGGYIDQVLRSSDLLPLDPSIKDLPFTRSVGDWLVLSGLQPGTYTLEFGGKGHAVTDPVTGTTILEEGWGATAKDTLVVGQTA